MSTIDGMRCVTRNTFVDVVPVQTASPLKHTQSLPNLGEADVWVNETEVWRLVPHAARSGLVSLAVRTF